MIKISAEQQALYMKTAKALKGSERRIFMASVVQALGRGGQRYAENVFGWNRRTVRKGLEELTTGQPKIDQFAARGRKRVEERLPHLLDHLREIVDRYSENAVICGASQLITHVSTAEVRRQLIEQKGYTDETLPCVATLRKRLSELGYQWRPSRKAALTVISH